MIENAMLQVYCKFGKLVRNRYWVILFTNFSGTGYVFKSMEMYVNMAHMQQYT